MTLKDDSPQRRSMRLKGYDYSNPGAYFLTICTRERRLLFEIDSIRSIAETCWLEIPAHFPYVELDAWVVMPNHIHGIILITRRGVQLNAPTRIHTKSDDLVRMSHLPQNHFSLISPAKDTLSVIVRTYKAAVTMQCRRIGHHDFGWQRNYYEHIIRYQNDLDRSRRYIVDNPLKWELDEYHPTHL